ncbi:zinc transporter 2 isoform X2 [Chenopodium quinoa]|uniref:zinc transporter 2 isoform X2 n=1 Tax=Chenopodium quinoa TaxID=63459 RepID=UPI000B7985ED|nr:zinc transporter 2 isoform X2 [Chenopodium quinoa]
MTTKTTNFLSPLLLLIITIIIPCISAHSGHQDQDTSTPSNHPNLREKSLIIVKIWCLIIIFLGTFIGGISPYFLKWNDAFLVLGTQFAGGVFLGTALMHFLSDANETFQDLTEKEYPFAFMLACFGYLLTLLADCVITYVFRKSNIQASHSNNNGIEEGLPNQKTNQHTNSTNHSEASHSTNHFANARLATASSLGDTILLITALCFHSVFEGIAIGVSETKADAWKALWTISLHKIFAAIAMAIALLRMIPDRPLLSCASYAFAFAISSPIGVAIGIIIDQTAQGTVADWIFAISMGIACGVFVYVSINHLLAKGYTPHNKVGVNTPFYRFLAVVLGVGVIAVVMIWDT